MATAPLDENEGEEGLLQTLPELLAAANCSHMLPTIQSSMHAPVTLEKCELWLKTGGVGLVMKFFRQAGLTDMALRTSVVKHLVEAHTTERLRPSPFELARMSSSNGGNSASSSGGGGNSLIRPLADLGVSGFNSLSSSSASVISSRVSSPRNSLTSPFMAIEIGDSKGGNSPTIRTFRVEGTPPALRRDQLVGPLPSSIGSVLEQQRRSDSPSAEWVMCKRPAPSVIS